MKEYLEYPDSMANIFLFSPGFFHTPLTTRILSYLNIYLKTPAWHLPPKVGVGDEKKAVHKEKTLVLLIVLDLVGIQW